MHTYIYKYIYVCVYTYIYIYEYMYVCIYIYIYKCMYAYIYVCMYISQRHAFAPACARSLCAPSYIYIEREQILYIYRYL